MESQPQNPELGRFLKLLGLFCQSVERKLTIET